MLTRLHHSKTFSWRMFTSNSCVKTSCTLCSILLFDQLSWKSKHQNAISPVKTLPGIPSRQEVDFDLFHWCKSPRHFFSYDHLNDSVTDLVLLRFFWYLHLTYGQVGHPQHTPSLFPEVSTWLFQHQDPGRGILQKAGKQNAECRMMVSGIECETDRYMIYDELKKG